jgi:hypothetical protein
VTIPNPFLVQHIHICIGRANRVICIPVNIAVGCLREVAIAPRSEPDIVFGKGHLGLGPKGRISGHARAGLSFVVLHRVVQGVKFLAQLVRMIRGEGEVPILEGFLLLKGKSGVVVCLLVVVCVFDVGLFHCPLVPIHNFHGRGGETCRLPQSVHGILTEHGNPVERHPAFCSKSHLYVVFIPLEQARNRAYVLRILGVDDGRSRAPGRRRLIFAAAARRGLANSVSIESH